MLQIVNVEEIQRYLLQISKMVNMLEKKDPKFFDTVKKWLSEVENVLVNNHLQTASDIAALRSSLISAERGVLPAGVVLTRSKTNRKINEAAAIDALQKANEQISNAIKGSLAQINEADRLTRQIAALAKRKWVLDGSNLDHSYFLKEAWKLISSDPELGTGCAHVIGLVGKNDALILLDRALEIV